MAYNFKSIADVEVVAEPAESANVLIEENGVIKKAPKTAVGGGSTEWDAVIEDCNTDDESYTRLISGDYDTLYNKIMVDKEVPKVKVISKYSWYGTNYACSSADVIYQIEGDYQYLRILFTAYGDRNERIILYLLPDNSFD